MTFFSIVIPVYNIEKYLSDCIESIISQEYEKVQIILIDDGSEDNSGSICDRYAEQDSRIEVIHKKNEGVVIARKQGVDQCKGDYIVCIDGDDWVENGFFEKLNYIIEQYNPEMVCCGYKSVGVKTVIYDVPYTEGYYSRSRIKEKVFPSLVCDKEGKIFPPHLWAKAFRNNTLTHRMFDIDKHINMGEDAAIIMPLIASVDSMYIMHDPLYSYRFNPESLTKSNNALRWDNPKIWYKIISTKMPKDKFCFDDQIYRYGALSVFYIAASQFNDNRNYKDIVGTINKELDDKLYRSFIKNAKFSHRCKQGLKIWIIKQRCFFLLRLFCKTYYKHRK